MVEKMLRRKGKEADAVGGGKYPAHGDAEIVSDDVLLRQMGIKVKSAK